MGTLFGAPVITFTLFIFGPLGGHDDRLGANTCLCILEKPEAFCYIEPKVKLVVVESQSWIPYVGHVKIVCSAQADK